MSTSAILLGVMQKLGGAYSGTTLSALELWAQSEGTPESWHNPLATTLSGYGGRAVNSAGVKSYPSDNDGIGATYQTLQGMGYRPIRRAIRRNAGYQAIWTAINGSPWCSHCQNGLYPVALYDAIHGAIHIPKPPPPPPSGGSGGGSPPPPGKQKTGFWHGKTEDNWASLTRTAGSDSVKSWQAINAIANRARNTGR